MPMRWPIGRLPEVGVDGADSIISEEQARIRRAVDPTEPPESMPADPLIVPKSLWNTIQAQHVRRLGQEMAVTHDGADLAFNLSVNAETERFQRQWDPPSEDTPRGWDDGYEQTRTATDSQLERAMVVSRQMEVGGPLSSPVDDTVQRLRIQSIDAEIDARFQAKRAQIESDIGKPLNPFQQAQLRSDLETEVRNARTQGPSIATNLSRGVFENAKGLMSDIGAAFDGKRFIKYLTVRNTSAIEAATGTGSFAENVPVNDQRFEELYKELPRPLQLVIDEMSPGNMALAVFGGGLAAALEGSGSVAGRAMANMVRPLAANPFEAYARQTSATVVARLGYEHTDGLPEPVRIGVGALGILLGANPDAFLSSTRKGMVAGISAFRQVPGRALFDVPDIIETAPRFGDSGLDSAAFNAVERFGSEAIDRARALAGQLRHSGDPLPVNQPLPEVPAAVAHHLRETVGLGTHGALARLADSVPALGWIQRNVANPSMQVSKPLIQGLYAQSAARSEFATRLYPSRLKYMTQLKEEFGDLVRPQGVQYVGEATRTLRGEAVSAADHPLTGTLVDMLEHPESYTLTEAQKKLVGALDYRNSLASDSLRREYGAEIGEWGGRAVNLPADMRQGGAFLPIVNTAEVSSVAAQADQSARALAIIGRRGERTFADHAARYADAVHGQNFEPELDVGALLTGLDEAKAFSAGQETLAWAVGGSIREVPGMELTRTTIGAREVWIPTEDAGQLARIASGGQQGALQKVLDLGEVIRQTHLGGDASPLTIQGALGFAATPVQSATALAKSVISGDAFKAFNPEQFAVDLARDSEGWLDFARAMGMPLRGTTPEEFSAGIFNLIPGLRSVAHANNNLFIAVTRGMRRVYDEQVAMLVREGTDPIAARDAAAEAVGNIFAVQNTAKLALSRGATRAERALITSTSFLRKPVSFMAEAASGYAKLGARGADLLTGGSISRRAAGAVDEAGSGAVDALRARVGTIEGQLAQATEAPRIESLTRRLELVKADLAAAENAAPGTAGQWARLTPRERVAVQLFAQMQGTIFGLSALSGALSASANNRDPLDMALRSVTPGTSDFLALHIGDQKIPIGGPYRSMMQAVAPNSDGVPFANFGRYAASKLAPGARLAFAAGEVGVRGNITDWTGNDVFDKRAGFVENVMRGLAFLGEQTVPVALATPIEDARRGELGTGTIERVGAGFLGQNITEPSPYQATEDDRRGGAWSLLRGDGVSPETLTAAGMSAPQATAALATHDLEGLRAAIGTRAANFYAESQAPNFPKSQEAYLADLKKRADGGDDSAAALLVSFETQQRLAGLAAQVETIPGTIPDGAAYRARRAGIISEQVGKSAAFKRTLEGMRGGANEIDNLTAEWYGLFDRARIPGSEEVDFDLFNKLEDQFVARIGRDKWDLVDGNINVAPRGANPMEVDLRQTRRDLEASGFFKINENIWKKLQADPSVPQAVRDDLAQYETFDEYHVDRAVKPLYEALTGMGFSPDVALQRAKESADGEPISQVFARLRRAEVATWASGNEELAQSGIKFGYVTPSEANLAASGAVPGATRVSTGQTATTNPLSAEDARAKQMDPEVNAIADAFLEGKSFSQLSVEYKRSAPAIEALLRRHFGGSPALARDNYRKEQK